jgi:hypothetical protein
MKVYGEVNFLQNAIVDAAFKIDTAFPANPVAGQVVFKNRTLYICGEINADSLPVWIPLTKQITAHTHTQSAANTTWTINHSLNTTSVQVMVYDLQNRVVIPNEIEIVDADTVAVYLGSAAQGKAVVLTGNFEGIAAPTYAYEFYQTTPSTTWTVTHSLGRYPIVRVFVGNQEVQPDTVTFDTNDTLTVTFATAQVGQVKLI